MSADLVLKLVIRKNHDISSSWSQRATADKKTSEMIQYL